MTKPNNFCCSILLHNLSPDELSSCFSSLRQEIASMRDVFAKRERDIYLTRHEVSEMLKCDLSTVHNWTKSGKLKAYGIGNRVYYKLSEIEADMVPLLSRKKNQ
jgi:excisionase family DNA binding protein